MGVRFPSVSSTTLVNANIAQAAETVVVTSPPFSPPLESSQIIIIGQFQSNMPAGTTQITLRIRRGTTTAGQQINLFNVDRVTASTGYEGTILYVDNPGVIAGIQYSITAAMSAAGGNAPISDACILVFAL